MWFSLSVTYAFCAVTLFCHSMNFVPAVEWVFLDDSYPWSIESPCANAARVAEPSVVMTKWPDSCRVLEAFELK